MSFDRYEELVNAAPDAIIVVDREGKIEIANLQAERMFGYPAAELIGQPVELLMPPRFRAGHHHHRSGYVTEPEMRPMGSGLELRGVRRDGVEFPIEISLSPIGSGPQTLFAASIRDIGDRKRLEEANQLAAARWSARWRAWRAPLRSSTATTGWCSATAPSAARSRSPWGPRSG